MKIIYTGVYQLHDIVCVCVNVNLHTERRESGSVVGKRGERRAVVRERERFDERFTAAAIY